MKINEKKVQAGVRFIIEGIGQSLNDPNYKNTPKRVAKLYREIMNPKRLRAHEASFPCTYDEMIVLRSHHVHTMCPHHLLPVELIVSVGYVPSKSMLGLSKLARVAESVLTRPMLQEEYTDLVAFTLHQLCEPKGIGVHVVGHHGCMRHRGVRTTGDVVTQRLRGVFLLNGETRNEFLQIVRGM